MQRVSTSKELQNYKRKARNVHESKYHFSAENFIPRKRKRFVRHTSSIPNVQRDAHSSKTVLRGTLVSQVAIL